MARDAPILALTCGDLSGIAPDITLLAWTQRGAHNVPPFCFIGPAEALSSRAAQLGLSAALAEVASLSEAGETFATALPVLSLQPEFAAATPGQPDGRNTASTLASIETAVALALRGEAGAVVTNPVSKHELKRNGFPFPGHTEFLAHLSARHGQPVVRPVMMLASPILRVVPATIHQPLRSVPGALSENLLIETAEITLASLKTLFCVDEPRLAVCGLNPHAGEKGDLGREEIEIITPALDRLRGAGHRVTGPHSADALFHDDARRHYDAVLAMYHDQALIPFKTLSFHDGVNVTLGLPFIRTSPDHGTAYGLAGTGRASPASLIAALKLAGEMAERSRASVHAG